MSRFSHVKDVAFLHEVIALYQREIERLCARIAALVAENARLRQDGNYEAAQLELAGLSRELKRLQDELNKRLAQLKDPSEEETDPPQSEPDRTHEPEASTPATSDNDTKRGDGKPKRPGHGPRGQPKLPVETVVHDLDEADRVCPHCNKPLHLLKGMSECSELITIIPPKIVLQRHERLQYGCPSRCGIETAIGPKKLIPGGRYSIEFAIEAAIAKYVEHTPLERLRQRYARLGLEVDVQTLFDQLYAAFVPLRPTVEAIYKNIVCQDLIHIDETPWQMMWPRGSEQWTLWTMSCPHASFYSLSDVRSSRVAGELLNGYDGAVMCDDAPIYAALEDNGGKNAKAELYTLFMPDGEMKQVTASTRSWVPGAFIRALCWAHALRKFKESARHFYRDSKIALGFIHRLYAAEDEAKRMAASRASPVSAPEAYRDALFEARTLVRKPLAEKALAEFHAWLTIPRVLGSTPLGKTIEYVLSNWKGLTAFLDEPVIELDNNPAERSLRGPVIGRKGFYGSRSHRGAQVACAFYTLFGSAKLCGIDPAAYVKRALIGALEKPGAILLPWDIAAEATSSAA